MSNRSITFQHLGECQILDVYAFHDIPVLYTCMDRIGNHYLVMLHTDTIEDDEWASTWMITSLSESRLERLRSGELDFYSVFKHAAFGMVDMVEIRGPWGGPSVETVSHRATADLTSDDLPLSGERV